MENVNKELFQRNLISDQQYGFLEAIRTRQIISVYAELRLILYLGILLFTGGVGYFAWQNMGRIGHLLSMFSLAVAIAVGFYFVGKFAKPYSNNRVTVPVVYFDYLLILVSLSVISLFTYVQVYFDLVELLLNWTSFISAAILLTMAYRYDNKALLAMGITALAAAVGIVITPVDWTGTWQITSDLYLTGMLLGILLLVVEQITYQKGIKKHFRFTIQNFGLLLFYLGGVGAIFNGNHQWMYATLVLAVAGILSYYTRKKKEFLFFLYSNLAAYIAFTYLFFKMIDFIMGNNITIFLYYFPVTCLGYVVFLITKKSHFSHD